MDESIYTSNEKSEDSIENSTNYNDSESYGNGTRKSSITSNDQKDKLGNSKLNGHSNDEEKQCLNASLQQLTSYKNQFYQGNELGKKVENNVKNCFKMFVNNDKEALKQLTDLHNSRREFKIHLKLIAMKKVSDFVFSFQNSIFWTIKLSIQKLSEKILGIYSLYRIIMTIKNLVYSDYNDINNMLKYEVQNVIDVILRYVFQVFQLNLSNILYTVIEQYFSLLIVGSIILVNIRSFLNLILFMYTMSFKFRARVSELLQVLMFSYAVGLFYVCSSIFLIFSLPITYR